MTRGRLERTFTKAAKLSPAAAVDLAAVELGKELARRIDLGNLRLIKQYHDVLTSLGMTPKSRSGAVAMPKAQPSKLDELRARRVKP